MMSYSQILSAALVGTAIAFVQPQLAVALTATQINKIASEISVLIEGINPGSGVIVSREGNTYFVLTAKHVVETEDEYVLVASDGRRYPLNYKTFKKIPGVDLAIVQFTSNQNYRVATLANYDYDTQFQYVFVSGWSATTPPPNRQRLFNAGLLISDDYKLAFLKDPASPGYDLFYTNITEVGMSGSPVLDTQGRVIGIHGNSEGEKIYNEQLQELSRVKLGFSSGIPISTFLRTARQPGLLLRLRVENSPPLELTPLEVRSLDAFLKVPSVGSGSNAIDWTNRGNELYRLERFEEALVAFNRALQLQSDFYPAWYGLGSVLSSLERYSEAIAAYDRATEIKPDFYLAWRDRGALFAYLQRYSESLTSFDKALQLKPNDYVAWYIRGDLLATHLQRFEEAIASYDRAIRIKSDFAPAWIGKGEALYDLKRYPEAIDALDKALRTDAKQVEAWVLKGLLFLQLERYSDALSAYDQSLALTPNDYQLWMLKAAALAGLKRDSEARKAAQQALRLKPNDPEILNFIHGIDASLPPSTSVTSRNSRPRYERPTPQKPSPGLLW